MAIYVRNDYKLHQLALLMARNRLASNHSTYHTHMISARLHLGSIEFSDSRRIHRLCSSCHAPEMVENYARPTLDQDVDFQRDNPAHVRHKTFIIPFSPTHTPVDTAEDRGLCNKTLYPCFSYADICHATPNYQDQTNLIKAATLIQRPITIRSPANTPRGNNLHTHLIKQYCLSICMPNITFP